MTETPRRRRAPRRPTTGKRTAAAKRPAPATGGDFAVPEPRVPALPPVAAFADLELPGGLLATLGEQGVTEPFPIQAATLPNALAGRDVLGRGRTGSGKTLAFGLAVLARLAGQRAEPRAPLALVLVPTRELAQQVTDALTPYAQSVSLRLATVVGGMSITRQAAALRRGAEVLVATPGRLADLIERGDCDLAQVGVTVLDEADQMADMGFLPQVTRLLKQVRPDGQRLLFSATLDRNVDRLVTQFLTDPVAHSVDPSAGAVTTMEHHVLYVADATEKRAVATRIAARDGRVILFLHTKRAVDRFTKRLLASGVRASGLHGGRSQPQRNRTLDQFKTGQVSALVATNVAARGIHIDDLDLVVNVDPPMDHKDYLHRGGRTARAGESGSVVTLVLPEEKREVGKLMADAGIRPRALQVKSTDEELARLTGAREPSGTAVVIEVPQQPAARPKARPASRSRRRPAAAGTGAAPAKRTGGGGGKTAGSGQKTAQAAGRKKTDRNPAGKTGQNPARKTAQSSARKTSGAPQRRRTSPGR
ncbi:ATP-dependent RNA helicase RhlB [Streptomyces sp. RB5]|uniref:ATP-dependent RNA helicase RhlB n=1 Tax=Streptomyces smaragdinus TaxID=2585196 RepID=A0A7K0CEC0_9ACTN|nr:DEAD/DEAH box helicase [Streptomyces smaragdinus]MQY11683.1 ATP-dependent RNA helicase RhlB [Streptomyces smaragdinus]